MARTSSGVKNLVTEDIPFSEGSWVAEVSEAPEFMIYPSIAKVKRCYWDDIAKEYVADLILYSANGDRIGRMSPAHGGPKSFEPCVPVAGWRAIGRPEFPLGRDGTEYRGWSASLTYIGTDS